MGDYRDYLLATKLSDNTVRNYEMRMRQAKTWCDRHGYRITTLSAGQMREMAAAFHKSHTVLGQLKSALGHFYRMKDIKGAPLDAIRVPAQPKGRNRALDPEHARALHKTARFWVPQGTAVMFGLYLGMRVTEIASAQWSRFDREQEWYTVIGKGDRSRTIPVHPTLRDDLQYVRARGDHIFPGQGSRHHVGSNTVWNWTLKVAVEAGIPRITTHQLRHTAITEIYDRTGDLLVAQEFAGHSRPDVTRRYTRLNVRRLVEAVNAINYEED
jgi:integrase/recombinase XerD